MFLEPRIFLTSDDAQQLAMHGLRSFASRCGAGEKHQAARNAQGLSNEEGPPVLRQMLHDVYGHHGIERCVAEGELIPGGSDEGFACSRACDGADVARNHRCSEQMGQPDLPTADFKDPGAEGDLLDNAPVPEEDVRI